MKGAVKMAVLGKQVRVVEVVRPELFEVDELIETEEVETDEKVSV